VSEGQKWLKGKRSTVGVRAQNQRRQEFITTVSSRFSVADDKLQVLERRVGRLHARQRLGVEDDHEAQVFGQGLTFFHLENSVLFALVIEYSLKMTGLFWRGCKNAEQVEVRYNHIRIAELPEAFDGFTILHLSDLHCDMSGRAMRRVANLLAGLRYDLCVLTGDFRGKTFGPYEAALDIVADLSPKISAPIYGVLGNHDSIRMVPDLEKIGIRILVNESDKIERGDQCIYIAGVDDPHYFRADNLEKASDSIPLDAFSILLSHTPEIYRQAAHAGFSLFLCGHTHGGQICLPGGFPLTLSSSSLLPRRLGAGSWKHHTMNGYTSVGAGSSVVPVRFNCPPEITLHYLEKIR
jgi:predicted MPP superfamily phosphohydrolase